MSVVQNYMQEDSILIDKIVYELKSQGIFDHFRKECIADVDTKPAYQNLRQRVEGSVGGFLSKQKWSPDMNKNQVREMLRKNIYESGFLETGVERIVDQVVNPKINSIFLPKVTEVVYKFFGIETEKKNQTAEDLLPTDLEAVSPESEKPDDSNLDDSKIDEDESPPFEPLEEQITYVPPEDNSIDSHMSGFSELDSNLSSKPLIVDTSNQDSMASKQSSDGRLSIVMSETDTGDDDGKSKKNFENLNEKIRKDDKLKNNKGSHEKSRSRSEKDRKDSKYSSSKDREKSSSKNGKSEHRDKERSKSHSSSSHRHSSSHRSKESSSKDRSKDKERSSKDYKHKDEKRKSHHSESKSSDKHKRDGHSSKSSTSRSRDSKKDPKKDKDPSENDNCKKRSDRRSTDRDSNDGQSGLKSSSGSYDSLTSSSQISQQGKTQESNSNSTSNGDSGNSDAHEDSNVTVLEEINDEISISAQSIKLNGKRKIRNQLLSESEKENKENKSEVKRVDVPESPPLRSVAVSAASWEALEAKLNESVANERYYQQSDYDSPDTPEKEDERVVAPQVGDECHYFERESCSKTERYVKFVSDLVGKLEKNIEKVEHSASVTEPAVDLLSSKEEITTGVKRKLIDTNTAVKQCNKRFNIEVHENFPLPLSPAESDNSVDKKSDISETSDRRNDVGDVDKAKRNLRAPAKKQRYSSEDLYKPRPFFSGSRRRSGRNIGGVD